MICHTALHRAAQVARHWAERDCPVVIHVDKIRGRDAFNAPSAKSAGRSGERAVLQAPPLRMGHMVSGGSQPDGERDAAGAFPSVRHVYLVSGSCLPLRPVEDLRSYLAARPMTDFIESVTTARSTGRSAA
jgi:hypothetical protein